MKNRSDYLQSHANLDEAFTSCHAELQQARRTIAHLRRGLGCGCETLEYVVPPDVEGKEFEYDDGPCPDEGCPGAVVDDECSHCGGDFQEEWKPGGVFVDRDQT